MYISTYDHHSKLFESTVKKWWGILQWEQKYGHVFKEVPCFSYRKGRSVGNQIVRADIQPKKTSCQTFLNTPKKGMYPCLTCHNCSAIIKGDSVRHPRKGHSIPHKRFSHM